MVFSSLNPASQGKMVETTKTQWQVPVSTVMPMDTKMQIVSKDFCFCFDFGLIYKSIFISL